ncbi:MAG: hypothetical protein GY856_06390 [bacterium]|nr:hypothetical protein [bacterium]
MKVLQLIPVVLSLLVLGAHFLRSGWTFLLLAVVALMVVALTVHRPWAARAAQTALVLGSLEWLRTLLVLAGARHDAGQPAVRMIVILGAVTAFTLLSALVFQTRTLSRSYGLDRR